MKVTDVKTFTVDCFRTNWVFVKIYTDEGITGVGEATLEYKEKALVGAVEHIKEYLVGKNPLDIEKHFHDIYRDAYWRGGAVLMSALSAVEMAYVTAQNDFRMAALAYLRAQGKISTWAMGSSDTTWSIQP